MSTIITLAITADLVDACEAADDTELASFYGHSIPEDAADLLNRYVAHVKRAARQEWGEDVEVIVDTTQIRCSGYTRRDRIEIDSDDYGDQDRADTWLQYTKDQCWLQACG